MDYIYEAIIFSKNFPIKLFAHRVNYVQNHWHDSLEVLFILHGKVNIAINNITYTLNKEDIIVINSNEIHTVSSQDDNIILALQIPNEFMKSYYNSKDIISYDCKSFLFEQHRQDSFSILRSLLAEMMWVYNKNEDGFELKLQILLLELIYTLWKNFKIVTVDNENKNGDKYFDRLSRVINYINENFNMDISLNTLAKQEYLSVSYLSKFFKKYLGASFLDYLNNIRLEHAVRDLIYTDNLISEIVLNNGFSNEKSFFNIFRNIYEDTPSQYRKNIKNNLSIFEEYKINTINYFQITNQDIFTHLFKYLNLDHNKTQDKKVSIFKDLGLIDITKPGKELYHSWKTLTTLGKAKDGLFSEVQKQLVILQELQMGSSKYLNNEEITYLKNKSVPQFKKSVKNINNEFLISTQLMPHEIKLLEINLKN